MTPPGAADRVPGASAPPPASSAPASRFPAPQDTVTPMREKHDENFKLLFAHKRPMADLLTGFIRRKLGGMFARVRFDLASLELLSAEYVDEKLRQSRGDRVWRLRYRAADGATSWVYLLVMLEFQSRVDPDMALRVLAYTAQLYLQIRRDERESGRAGPLPPVLPIVIYNGRARWSAAHEVREEIAPAEEELERFQPRQGYLLLDVHRLRPADLPEGNVMSARFALEHGDPEAVPAVVAALRRLLAGPEYASLRRAFGATLRHMLETNRFGASDGALEARLRQVGDLEDLGTMESLFAERLDEWVAERAARSEARGLERGEARGLERGLERERALLARQAGRKFGPDAASRLAAAVATVDDPDRLEEVGEAVIVCATGAELLARAEEIARRA